MPAQLETALQLLHQRFVAPGDDPDALALLKRQLDAALANRAQNPMAVFGVTSRGPASTTSLGNAGVPLMTPIVST